MHIDRYLVIALFGGYVAKVSVLGASLSDAAIILVLAAAHFLQNHHNFNKQINELKQELLDLNVEFKEQNEKVLTTIKSQDEAIAELKSSLAGVKIASGMRAIK